MRGTPERSGRAISKPYDPMSTLCRLGELEAIAQVSDARKYPPLIQLEWAAWCAGVGPHLMDATREVGEEGLGLAVQKKRHCSTRILLHTRGGPERLPRRALAMDDR